MESIVLQSRVSTRASLSNSCSTFLHLTTANSSIQTSSSRPIAPIAKSSKVFDSSNRTNSRSPTRSFPPIMTLGQRSLSNTSVSSALSSALIDSCGDGQFSDADTDDDINELREKKRLKLECSRSIERNEIQSTCSVTRHDTGSNLPITNHRNVVDNQKSSNVKEVESDGSARKSRPQKNGTNNSSNSSKTTTPTLTSKQSPSSNCDTSSQLPMATRRLAMLVGIPESSQAIIQSTLSLPSSRLNAPCRTQSQSNTNVVRNTPPPCTTKHTGATTSLPSLHRSKVSAYGGKSMNPLALSKSNSSLINPALSAKNDCKSPAPCSSYATQNEASSNTLPHSIRNGSGKFTAPRYGKTSSCSHDFTMPAPGTFSIRAPPSSQILRSFNSPTLELSGSTNPELNGLENCEEGSEIDGFSQAPSTYCAPSIDESTITAMTPEGTVTDGAGSRKRKSRSSKPPKSTSQAGRNQNIETEIELVKPPPTINGKISHARKVPPGYVKRTPNSFLMFRSHVIANKLLPPGVENDNRQISRVVSGLWAGLSEDDLRTWQEASRELRAAVRAKNPGLKHAPNQKRREVIRRRRNGQLPGETPEQRVEREKATAAALAKVIIEGRGDNLDPARLAQLTNVSVQPSVSNASTNSRETSRPEFRAPTYRLSNATLIQGITPRSEYAESTLTNSPAPDPRRSLSCVPESHLDALLASQAPLTPKTTASGPSTAKLFNDCQDSNDPLPSREPVVPFQDLQENQQKAYIQTNLESTFERISPEIKYQQPLMSPTSPVISEKLSYQPSETGLSSNIFLALGSTSSAPQSFPNTFTNEMLRSLGLTAADLGLDFAASDPLLSVTASTMNDTLSSSKCFSPENDRLENNSSVWSHETGFTNLGDFSPSQYPFRDLGSSQGMSSQETSVRNGDDTYATLDPLSQLDASNPLELNSLINDCYTEPLNCDGLNFDSLYLNCTPNSISLDLEESCQSFFSRTL